MPLALLDPTDTTKFPFISLTFRAALAALINPVITAINNLGNLGQNASVTLAMLAADALAEMTTRANTAASAAQAAAATDATTKANAAQAAAIALNNPRAYLITGVDAGGGNQQITATGIKVGDVLTIAIDLTNSLDVSADFEPTATVQNKVVQTAQNLTGMKVLVIYAPKS